QLISMKLPIDAMEIFKYNFEKYPNTFTTLVGMTRGNAAMGDYDKALKFALKALPLAPDSANKINLESMIKKLTEKKDIN
ncbi:MAG: tetratricopeptide repeat protein, partial [Saprospiraceae bacterium]